MSQDWCFSPFKQFGGIINFRFLPICPSVCSSVNQEFFHFFLRLGSTYFDENMWFLEVAVNRYGVKAQEFCHTSICARASLGLIRRTGLPFDIWYFKSFINMFLPAMFKLILPRKMMMFMGSKDKDISLFALSLHASLEKFIYACDLVSVQFCVTSCSYN